MIFFLFLNWFVLHSYCIKDKVLYEVENGLFLDETKGRLVAHHCTFNIEFKVGMSIKYCGFHLMYYMFCVVASCNFMGWMCIIAWFYAFYKNGNATFVHILRINVDPVSCFNFILLFVIRFYLFFIHIVLCTNVHARVAPEDNNDVINDFLNFY